MGNRCILFFMDNDALVDVINRQSCKDKSLTAFVWKLVLICLQHNIVLKAKHIRGDHSHLADSLSCLQVQTFWHLAPPYMDQLPTDIPLHLQPQLASIVESSLQPSSLPTCQQAWKLFTQFTHVTFQGASIQFPISPPMIALFVA